MSICSYHIHNSHSIWNVMVHFFLVFNFIRIETLNMKKKKKKAQGPFFAFRFSIKSISTPKSTSLTHTHLTTFTHHNRRHCVHSVFLYFFSAPLLHSIHKYNVYNWRRKIENFLEISFKRRLCLNKKTSYIHTYNCEGVCFVSIVHSWTSHHIFWTFLFTRISHIHMSTLK